ncbi:hypothetical protein [Sphingobacterium yanglingense]|uniref:Uncharacterized protein n=1 Tax=Sphingobacterium yanglingense TaxID=1437280 RepID=A0A4R6WR38_9SPHI|nr:hypothetical protein [Sphingobacterium yanglingense]TDQ79096.1 hypothetical protein CLV99_0528 [Sphingobacterium yanglingense]
MRKRLFNYSLFLLWCMLAAYLINVTVKIFTPGDRIGAPSFIGIYMGTIVLMMIYVGIINKAYNEIIADKEFEDRDAELIGLGNYLLFAVVPPIIIHRMLLHVALVIATNGEVNFSDMLFNRAYWQQDFPFLLMSLLVPALFFYYWPQYRLFEKEKVKVFVDRKVLVEATWRDYKNPYLLLGQLRNVLDLEIDFKGGKIRLFDIVFIVYENKSYFAILTDGRKCILPRFEAGMLDGLLLGGWFVKINNNVRVNMLYLQYPMQNKKEILLEETVANVLFAPENAYDPSLLRIGRRCVKYVNAFLESMDDIPDSGWNERVLEVEE